MLTFIALLLTFKFSQYGEFLRKRATDITLAGTPSIIGVNNDIKELTIPGLPPRYYSITPLIDIHYFLQQIACEEFASALGNFYNNLTHILIINKVLASDNREACFNFGYVLAQVARSKEISESDALFQKAFACYSKAAVPGFYLQENVLRYW